MDYNQSYIDSFGEVYLHSLLKNPKALKNIANTYLHQFDENFFSYETGILIKESLDHYVYKKIHTDKYFTQSIEFKNYLEHLEYICRNNKEGEYYIEYITNIIFKNEENRNIIFNNVVDSNEFKSDFTFNVLQAKKKIQEIHKKIKNSSRISQQELDFICNCVVNNNNITNDLHKEVFVYILNNMKKYDDLTINYKVLSVIVSYLPVPFRKLDKKHFFDTRIRIVDIPLKDSKGISTQDKNGNYISAINARSIPKRGICLIGKPLAKKCMSFKKNSVYKHRAGIDVNDIYSLIFIVLHELSHQYQEYCAYQESFTNAGFSYILNSINNQVLGDYKNNHDADEMEIHADELAWSELKMLFTSNKYIHDEAERDFFYKICPINSRACGARRAFSRKTNSTEMERIYHGIYDIKTFSKTIRESKDIKSYYQAYPMLKKVINSEGEYNLKLLAIPDFVDNFQTLSGETDGQIGCELAHYMVENYEERFINAIKNRVFSTNELEVIIKNLDQLDHADAYNLDYLARSSFKQFENTRHYGDLTNLGATAFYFFERNARALYKIEVYKKYITQYYPEIKTYYDNRNFLKLLDYCIVLNQEEINKLTDICYLYETSGNENLENLSNYIKEKISVQEQTVKNI